MSNFDFKSLSKSFGSKRYTELTFKFSASSTDADVKSTSLPRVDSSFFTLNLRMGGNWILSLSSI